MLIQVIHFGEKLVLPVFLISLDPISEAVIGAQPTRMNDEGLAEMLQIIKIPEL